MYSTLLSTSIGTSLLLAHAHYFVHTTKVFTIYIHEDSKIQNYPRNYRHIFFLWPFIYGFLNDFNSINSARIY